MLSNGALCTMCGGTLIRLDEKDTYKCEFCGTVFHEDAVQKEIDSITQFLNEKEQEKLSNLRKLLWAKVNETYNDSQEVLRLSREIKQLKPDDFLANFYEAANLDTEELFVDFLEKIDVEGHYSEMGTVLTYSLKSISPKNMLAICNLIERAYKQRDLSLYNEYRTKYDEQCNMISDCVYDPAYPRDVFVCYSSKDMAHVESLVKFLEDQGLLCFVAIRNLQHGRAAVQNYWNAIHTAIENCKCIVFLSSTNSRDMHCDALQELRYVLSLEQKLNRKIKKIEFLLENYTGALVERNFKRVFEGLEYCYDQITVYDRIMMDDEPSPVTLDPVLAVQKEVKFCRNCGQENADNAKFCFACGKDVFVATQAEYIEYLKQEKAAFEQQAARAQQYYQNNSMPSRQYDEPTSYAANRSSADRYVYQREPKNQASNQQSQTRSGTSRFNTSPEITEISKGQHLVLPENVRKAHVVVENEYKLDNVEADLYVFMLDNTERVLSEADLVFFGNPTSLNNSVRMQENGRNNEVDVLFYKVNQDIARIRFMLAFNADDGRVLNFSMLKKSTIRIELEDETFRLQLSDIGRCESVCAFEFYRSRDRWKLNVQAAALNEHIMTLCGNYGIEVE